MGESQCKKLLNTYHIFAHNIFSENKLLANPQKLKKNGMVFMSLNQKQYINMHITKGRKTVKLQTQGQGSCPQV